MMQSETYSPSYLMADRAEVITFIPKDQGGRRGVELRLFLPRHSMSLDYLEEYVGQDVRLSMERLVHQEEIDFNAPATGSADETVTALRKPEPEAMDNLPPKKQELGLMDPERFFWVRITQLPASEGLLEDIIGAVAKISGISEDAARASIAKLPFTLPDQYAGDAHDAVVARLLGLGAGVRVEPVEGGDREITAADLLALRGEYWLRFFEVPTEPETVKQIEKTLKTLTGLPVKDVRRRLASIEIFAATDPWALPHVFGAWATKDQCVLDLVALGVNIRIDPRAEGEEFRENYLRNAISTAPSTKLEAVPV
jgi:hypothetical protein